MNEVQERSIMYMENENYWKRVEHKLDLLVRLLTEIRGVLKIIMCVVAFATGLIMFRS